jgi:hypothetical protein
VSIETIFAAMVLIGVSLVMCPWLVFGLIAFGRGGRGSEPGS